MVRWLNLACVIVDRRQEFILRAVENDRLPDALLAGFKTFTNLQRVITPYMKLCSSCLSNLRMSERL